MPRRPLGRHRSHERLAEPRLIRLGSDVVRYRRHDLRVQEQARLEGEMGGFVHGVPGKVRHRGRERAVARLIRTERTGIPRERRDDTFRREPGRVAPRHHVPFPRGVPVQIHQHLRMQQRRPGVRINPESLIVGRGKGRRGLHDLDGHIVAKQHRRSGRAIVGQRDECPSCIANGQAWEVAAGRRQLRFSCVAMDHTQPRPVMVEDAVAGSGARHHGGGGVRQVNFDTQRGVEAFRRLAGGGDAAGRHGLAEAAVERELNRNVPIRGAADTGTLAAVIRMDAQRVNSRGHELRIIRTIICSLIPYAHALGFGVWDLGFQGLLCGIDVHPRGDSSGARRQRCGCCSGHARPRRILRR